MNPYGTLLRIAMSWNEISELGAVMGNPTVASGIATCTVERPPVDSALRQSRNAEQSQFWAGTAVAEFAKQSQFLRLGRSGTPHVCRRELRNKANVGRARQRRRLATWLTTCAPVANRRCRECFALVQRRVINPSPVTNLPHIYPRPASRRNRADSSGGVGLM